MEQELKKESPAERAERLVNGWLEDTRTLPVTLQLARLGILLANEFREIETRAPATWIPYDPGRAPESGRYAVLLEVPYATAYAISSAHHGSKWNLSQQWHELKAEVKYYLPLPALPSLPEGKEGG